MNAPTPSSLAPDALARRLAELVADERGALVEFLLHLEEFDRRRAWAEAGYDSLWTYCQRVLHLREGPAGRRIATMRIVRQFPRLADSLRDGRLCLSTVTLLSPILREENLDEVVARAAYKTKAEVEHLVASALPREAPRDGIRRLPERLGSGEVPPPTPAIDTAVASTSDAPAPEAPPLAVTAPPSGPNAGPPPERRPAPARATLTPVAADVYSLRVTLHAALKADLDELTALLSHKIPNGDLAAVLGEAVQCALEKHGRRKGSRAPSRERTVAREGSRHESRSPRDARHRPHISAHVRREVWRRDGGRCTWCGPDGHRCESRWRLEFDHITPVALGGGFTANDLRLRCRVHNQLYAEQVFGADHMARFRRDGPERVRLLIPG